MVFQERDLDLSNEQQRQEENDQLRKQFAQAANAFHGWLTETRSVLIVCPFKPCIMWSFCNILLDNLKPNQSLARYRIVGQSDIWRRPII